MAALLLKIFSLLLPFLKEVILGDETSKSKHDKTVYFMTALVIAMFLMLNFIKTTAVALHNDLNIAKAEIVELKTKVDELKNHTGGCKEKMSDMQTKINAQTTQIDELKSKADIKEDPVIVNPVVDKDTGELLTKFKNIRE